MIRRAAAPALLVALALTTAAQELRPVPTDRPPVRRPVGGDWSAGLLWNGFSYDWRDHPHRLSLLTSRTSVDRVDRYTGHLTGRHEFEVRIGSFPADAADYVGHTEAVRSTTVDFAHVRVGPIELAAPINDPAEQTIACRFDPADLGLPAGTVRTRRVAALLGGFRIHRVVVDGHDSGWHFQGLGVSVGGARYEADGRIAFDATAFVHAADSPDAINGFDYSGDWREAWGPTRYRVWIDVVLVAGSRRDLAVRSVTRRHEVDDLTTSATRSSRVRLAGAARFPDRRAFLGTSGFRVEIDADTRREGRYIRSLEVSADRFVYHPSTGLGAFTVTHGFSNRSAIPFRWRMTSSSTHHLIEVRDRDLEREAGRVEGRIDTGSIETQEVLFGD